MKKLLFVNCTSRKGSRTLALCNHFLSLRKDRKISEIKVFSLGLQPFDEKRLAKRDEDVANADFSSADYDLAKQFADADEIVIGAPFWDCSFPAALKIFVENVSVNGLTFGYSESGQVKLCKAQKLTYITAVGGFLQENPSVKAYMQELCSLFCIPEFEFFAAQGLDVFPQNESEILEETKAKM